jgi:hypothetical protein
MKYASTNAQAHKKQEGRDRTNQKRPETEAVQSVPKSVYV